VGSRALLIAVVCISSVIGSHDNYYDTLSLTPSHPLTREFWQYMYKCRDNSTYCKEHLHTISLLSVKMSNEHAALLLHDRAEAIIMEAFYYITPTSEVGKKLSHVLSVLFFSQGHYEKARELWSALSPTDVTSMRSRAAQEVLMASQEDGGLRALSNYTTLLGERFYDLVAPFAGLPERSHHDVTDSNTTVGNLTVVHTVRRSPPTSETEALYLEMLLSEAQGGVRVQAKLSDSHLSATDLSRPLTTAQHFQLGVSLSKLSLYDLAQHHVAMSATPWDPMYHRLRYTLSLPPVHTSIRALALSVDNFENQIEKYILRDALKSPSVVSICESFEDSGFVLGVLPLLHLVGYNAPRREALMGYSPVALPILLSEFYVNMCSTNSPQSKHYIPPPTAAEMFSVQRKREGVLIEDLDRDRGRKADRKLRVGVISGSFDSLSGRIVVGMLEASRGSVRSRVELIAMCFPTPRDTITERTKSLFNGHVNLYPGNRTETLYRIRRTDLDVVIFADAGQDCRSFALAHYRLAPYQMALWGWGGTLGVKTIDHYVFPEVLWTGSKCVLPGGLVKHPQNLYSEQVVFLEGLPPVARMRKESAPTFARTPGDWLKLQDRLLLPPLNRSHLYLFPGSVRYLHPEMDAAISILLKTDHLAIIIFTSPLMGRDMLPPLHPAVRHDQTHPVMPTAATSRLRARLIPLLGDAVNRLRFLPPIDDHTFHILRSYAVAVLDSFPVGMHLPVLESMAAGVPVVSAPHLQECTNSYAVGVAQSLKLELVNQNSFSWPTTAEEYAVFAMRLAREPHLRKLFDPRHAKTSRQLQKDADHASQLLSFALQLHHV